jgi:hypothetical protein
MFAIFSNHPGNGNQNNPSQNSYQQENKQQMLAKVQGKMIP